MKEKYEAPMMEMIEFNREEVVTMSGQGDETLRDPRQALSAGAPAGGFSAFYCLLSGKSV